MQNITHESDTLYDPSLHAQEIESLETLVIELKRLLIRYQAVLTEEDMRKQMEALEQWVESQRDGSVPASVISESGVLWLQALQDRLKLSADEMLRLEGEGGQSADVEQSEKISELLKTIRRIGNIIDTAHTIRNH